MPAKLAEADHMTIEAVLAFTDHCPDGERRELIAGAAALNSAPAQWHQPIAMNICSILHAAKLAHRMNGVCPRRPDPTHHT